MIVVIKRLEMEKILLKQIALTNIRNIWKGYIGLINTSSILRQWEKLKNSRREWS